MREIYGRPINGHKTADLHMHTTGSLDVRRRGNGLTPQEAVLSAEASGLAALAITDHDEYSSAATALEFSVRENLHVEVIAGMEITTKDGHLIGLFLNSPIAKGLSMADSIREIHRQNALAIIPHPFFRVLKSLNPKTLAMIRGSQDPEIYLDGFEIANRGIMDIHSRKPSYVDTNRLARKTYEKNNHKLGAKIGSSDGHRMTVGRGLTAFQDDLRIAIQNKKTMAVVLEQEDHWSLLLQAVTLFGEERVLEGLTLKQFRDRAIKQLGKRT